MDIQPVVGRCDFTGDMYVLKCCCCSSVTEIEPFADNILIMVCPMCSHRQPVDLFVNGVRCG